MKHFFLEMFPFLRKKNTFQVKNNYIFYPLFIYVFEYFHGKIETNMRISPLKQLHK